MNEGAIKLIQVTEINLMSIQSIGEEIGAFFIVIHWRDPAKECHQTKNLAKRHAI